MFRLTVLGDIAVASNREGSSLDASTRRLLSVLVAWGGRPVPPTELAYEVGVRGSALKAWVSRRRQILGADLLPGATKGGPGYRLEIARADVDAWWLLDRSDQPLGDATDAQLLAVLTPGEAFPGILDTDVERLGTVREEIRRAKRNLAIEVVHAERRVVMAGIVGLVDGLLEDDPYDEELAEANARLRWLLFGRRHGLEALHHFRLQLLDAGLSPSPSLEQLETTLLAEPGSDATGLSLASPAAPDLQDEPGRAFPPSLEELRPHPSITGDGASPRDALPASQWMIVAGPAGAGKSSFVAEAAAAAFDDGASVLHLEPFRFGPEPWFAPFAETFPDVAQLIAELTEARADIAAFRHAVMLAVHANLNHVAAAAPVVVVITRAHRLEAESVEALWYLARSPQTDNLSVLIAGDTAQPGQAPAGSWAGTGVSAAWEAFAEGIVASGLGAAVAVPPLQVDEVDQLIRDVHPDIGRNRARLLAARITESSGGLPGLARPLIRNLVAGSGDLPDDRLDATDPLRRLITTLPEPAQTVGAVAAISGSRFSADEVAALSLLPKAEVVEILTGLYRKGLIAVDPPMGSYRFATSGAAEAFLDTALPDQRVIWHQRAADLFDGHPVRRARHLVAISSGPEAARAVLEAAEVNVAMGQHHEAVADYERAIEMADQPLSPSSCIGFVRALDLCGRHTEADDVRDRAFWTAIDLDDHPTALGVLLASWPEAEAIAQPEPTATRLDAIDQGRLSPDEQVLYAVHWSRHLAMSGRADDAAGVIDQASGAAVTSANRIDLALATRYVQSVHSSPQNCLDLLDRLQPLVADIDIARRADVLVHRGIDAYEIGSAARLGAVRDELWTIVDQASPLRRWHALLLDGLLAADQDDPVATSHRRAAFEHAIGHGVRDAIGVRLAGDLAERWLQGVPLEAADVLGPDEISTLEQTPPLLEAGQALVLESMGQGDAALAAAEHVTEVALARPNRWSAPSIAIVAEVLARTARHELREAARVRLLERGDVMLLLGAFVAGLGPAAHWAAFLEPDPSGRRQLRRRARELADRAGSARWVRLTSDAR